MQSIRVRRVVLLLLLAACSSDGTGPGDGGDNGGNNGGNNPGGNQVLSGLVEVRISGVSFDPAHITVAAGTTVRWVNQSGEFHTITPESASQAGVWTRTETSSRGTALEHTFRTTGQTYRYRCEPHSSTNFTSGMVGSITVVTQ